MTHIIHSLLFLGLVLLPSQLGKHFWPPESLVLGRRIDYLSPTLYLTDILLLSFVVLVWVKRKSARRSIFATPFISLSLLLLVSFLLSPVKVVTGYVSLRLLLLALWVVSVWKWQPSVTTLLRPVWVSAIYSSTLAVWQFLSQRSIGGLLYFLGERSFTAATPGIAQTVVEGRLLLRPYATFAHPNQLGGFFVVIVALILGVGAQLQLTRFDTALIKTALGMSVVGILLSFSRSAWLVSLAFFFYLCWTRFAYKRRRLLLLVTLLGLVVLIEELSLGRFVGLVAYDQRSIVERLVLFEAAYQLIRTAPLLGTGLGSFIHLLPSVSSPPFILQPVHSMYLLIFVEMGMLGLTLFLALLLACLRISLKYHNLLWLPLLSIAVLGAVDHYWVTLLQTQFLFALIIVLSLMPLSVKPKKTQMLTSKK